MTRYNDVKVDYWIRLDYQNLNLMWTIYVENLEKKWRYWYD